MSEKRNNKSATAAEAPIPRRGFLIGAGTAVAAGLADTQSANAQSAAPAANEPEPLLTLTPTEHAFVVAAADTLIPADELSPSGSDCGVAAFIDRQLAGAYGNGARLYREGPFPKGKPELGYQLPLNPREFFRAGIAAANTWTRKTYGKDFDRLAEAQRVAALQAMETGKAEFSGLSSKEFFEALLLISMEGFFADPIYGGNRDKAAWKMIGYPGLPATYREEFLSYRGKKYDKPPRSIADFS
ncbi:MAG TPA: gluconate 2-dehydrogenase subunit 3 family protein [Xanthobacteraceae bacterium]|nr:gluconate 2-dehydrogenase subunit 3 family protein [Xanthobacteraceae bacterium]